MTQHPSPAAAQAASIPSPARWTPPARQRLFLTALLDSGNVSHAARAVGMSRSSAHRLRQRLAGTTFDRTWEQALVLHAGRMGDSFADPMHNKR
ncbi:LysR family transcriptional regulator [Sphingobium sp.]|uniref:LysR family transcriptional regulator n=1 Tax=Sphingobium sp. TaxID=1912891 RepID=UPI003B3A6C80